MGFCMNTKMVIKQYLPNLSEVSVVVLTAALLIGTGGPSKQGLRLGGAFLKIKHLLMLKPISSI
jgi:hypothetical protein